MREIKSDNERNGVVVYQLILQRPDGEVAGNLPVPVEITIKGGTVRAEINGSTPWTPPLHDVYRKIGDDTARQQKLLESLASEMVVAAMKDAMAPYLSSERTPITEEEADNPQTSLFGDF